MSRTPNNYGTISFTGITEGDVAGSWLLSYLTADCLDVAVATFKSREAALDMAAQIDDLTGIEHEWTVETIFKNPQFADELIDMMGMDPGCYGCTGCDVDPDEDFDDEDDWDDEDPDDEDPDEDDWDDDEDMCFGCDHYAMCHDIDDGLNPGEGWRADA